MSKGEWQCRLVLAGLLGLVLVMSVIIPRAPEIGLCSFKRLTGLPCAGCGMTRSFIALGHGDWTAGFEWHPIGVLLYMAMVLMLPLLLWEMRNRHILITLNRRTIVIFVVSLVAAMVVVWGIRLSFFQYGHWMSMPLHWQDL